MSDGTILVVKWIQTKCRKLKSGLDCLWKHFTFLLKSKTYLFNEKSMGAALVPTQLNALVSQKHNKDSLGLFVCLMNLKSKALIFKIILVSTLGMSSILKPIPEQKQSRSNSWKWYLLLAKLSRNIFVGKKNANIDHNGQNTSLNLLFWNASLSKGNST